LEGLPPEALDWSPGPDVNTIDVLVAHLAGAERYWIGDLVGGEPSQRVREAEFRVRGRDGAALRAQLDQTLAHSRGVLARLSLEDLGQVRHASISGQSATVAWCLLHALEHSAEHVGHIQLMRQWWEQRSPGRATGGTR
jgi:uncharacterized damage-inducible protein DinB